MFNNAFFSLIGSGTDQSNYRCKKADASSPVILSGTASVNLGQDCIVTFSTITKPTNKITINMEYTSDNGSTWTKIDSYIIPIPTLWVRPLGKMQYNTASDFSGTYTAAVACGAFSGMSGTINKATAANYFLSRSDFSNSPFANSSVYPPNHGNPSFRGGYLSRDTDTTILGEWGLIDKYLGWGNNEIYWTGEDYSQFSMFRVYPNGYIGADSPTNSSLFAVCRE